MTIDIERIKSTKLGREWLSRFVELVWGLLETPVRRRLLTAQGIGERLFIDSRLEPHASDGCGDLVIALEGRGLIVVDWRQFKRLTPLGVEVYLYGRKQGRTGGASDKRLKDGGQCR